MVDDLAQETLLRAHRTMPADVRNPQAWALRAAHSAVVDHFRATGRRMDAATEPDLLAALAPLPPADSSDRPDAGLGAEADRALDVAIARCIGAGVRALPAGQREAILLTGPGDLSQAEAARRAGISLPGLRSRVQRGRVQVREAAESCCAFELDGRGRPIGMQPRGDAPCSCGCPR